jgi:DNA polymerase-3 subunit gamma/tau
MVGQEQVTGPLAQAVQLGRIAPAYLFSGPRGSGKTTTARLLARALNCTSRTGAEPCNECPSCLGILSGSSLDVIEIDGASNRGIDDIRDIREHVRYAPAGGGKKVYIVDEVHMLTEQAFNAFLKTLEEPPPHVVFVFATTDPNDLLETVRSRCQRYEFHRITAAEAYGRLESIARSEKLEIEEGALHFLAKRADGSLRDALVLLDQAANAVAGMITEARVRAQLGHAGADFYFQLSEAIAAREPEAALKLLFESLSAGARETTLFAGLCEHYRHLMLARVSPSVEGLLEGTPETLARYRDLAAATPEEDLLQILDLCLDGASRLERSAHPRFQLELLIVTLARLDSVKSLQKILEQLEGAGPGPASPRQKGASQAPAQGAAPVSSAPQASPGAPTSSAAPPPRATMAEPARRPQTSPPAASAASRLGSLRGSASRAAEAPVNLESLLDFPREIWNAVLEKARSKTLLFAFLGNAVPLGHGDGALCLAVPNPTMKSQLEDKDHARFIEGALQEFNAPAARFRCIVHKVEGHAEPGPAPEVQVAGEPQAGLVDKVIQMFGGEVVS